MRTLLTVVLFSLALTCEGFAQAPNCSYGKMTFEGATASCDPSPTQTPPYQPGTDLVNLSVFTYSDQCYSDGPGGTGLYYTQTSHVTGYGQCESLGYHPGITWAMCFSKSTPVEVDGANGNDPNRMYNYAYDYYWLGNAPKAGNCQPTGTFRVDLKQCSAHACPPPPNCTTSPTFVCSNGENGGSVSPTCTNGQWSCNGAASCALPPPQYVCNQGEYGSPSCGNSGWYCYQGASPIVIDTAGTGFNFTDYKHGVIFDIEGDGNPRQVSWIAADSRNGWLALPHDGKVTNGKELFGNFTAQPPSENPNGFLALAVYDLPEHGGNGDGIIDWHDAVWSKLRIWIDANHDGVSQPDELYSLPVLGIYSLSLKYTESRFTELGNQFRYKGVVNPEGKPKDDPVDRTMYDVFLATGPSNGTKKATGSDHTLPADHKLLP